MRPGPDALWLTDGVSMRALVLALILLFCSAGISMAAPWRITKDHWSEADEEGFAKFVQAIGESDCNSTERCLHSAANPWYDPKESLGDLDTDCAKLPYLLRGYYAWKNGLPFSYVNGVSGRGGDLRYTSGNHSVSRLDLIDDGGGFNGPSALRVMIGNVFSGTYRTDAGSDEKVPSDFYSPAITPKAIRPGTVIYDVNGHVAIAYKVDEDGRIYYMDAHPDFTVSRSVYGAQFGQSRVGLGGGLKKWRPQTLIGARRDKAGFFIGGHIVLTPNAKIPDFSLVQYVGTEPNPAGDVANARFAYNNTPLGFYEFVRVAVSGGKMEFNPVYELQTTMRTLCNDLKDRAQFVSMAFSENIASRFHPTRLPNNIYGTDDDEWETYSTPSRDARLKTAFAQFYHDMGEMMSLYVKRDERIVYDGYDLKADLASAYTREANACIVSYTNSESRPVAMNFDAMAKRLFAMSFDPYNCIELRWGATGAEAASCKDPQIKRRWYEAEQRLRNQIDRPYDVTMNFTLDDLARAAPHSGTDTPPPIDVRALIESTGPRVAFQGMAPIGR